MKKIEQKHLCSQTKDFTCRLYFKEGKKTPKGVSAVVQSVPMKTLNLVNIWKGGIWINWEYGVIGNVRSSQCLQYMQTPVRLAGA